MEVTHLLKKNETNLASKTSSHHAVAKHQDVVSLKAISMTNHPGNLHVHNLFGVEISKRSS